MALEVVPPVKQDSEISAEFNGHLQGLRALTTVHDLLQKGAFPYGYRNALELGIAFIESLHTQSTEQALLHPEADKVADLVALKEARAKLETEKKTIEKAEQKRVKKAVKRKKNV